MPLRLQAESGLIHETGTLERISFPAADNGGLSAAVSIAFLNRAPSHPDDRGLPTPRQPQQPRARGREIEADSASASLSTLLQAPVCDSAHHGEAGQHQRVALGFWHGGHIDVVEQYAGELAAGDIGKGQCGRRRNDGIEEKRRVFPCRRTTWSERAGVPKSTITE